MIRFFFVLASSIVFSGPAFACMGPQFEDHHFPSCTIPLPEANERVSVIFGNAANELSDHHIGEPNRRTRLVTLQIDETDAQNYLVLGAREQTIWRLTGDVESVSKVVVLGATDVGPNGAGVMGLPEDRISFTSPDLTALDSVLRTSCTRVAKACIPSQWFGEEPDKRVSLHPEPTQSRQRVDQVVTWQSRQRDTSSKTISIVSPEVSDAMVSISPEWVVSRTPAQPYETLPGQPGLQALVESGALIPATSSENRHIVQEYAATFSARYQTRFDPDFLMTPTVDYIITKEITLPPELPPTSFMVASGVPAPEMNGNRGYSVCLYFEERADQPVSGSGINSNLCRLNRISRAVPDDEQDILRAAAGFDRLEIGSQNCQMVSFESGTHIATVALSEGQFRRYRDDPIRQISVEVTREGPTALFLSMEGGPVQWNISGSQVVAVYSRGGPSLGLAEVFLNGQPYEYSRLRSPDENCPQFAPLWPNRLGPSVAHLDKMFELLTTQRIDELITFTETDRTWRSPNSPTPVYVID